MCGEGCRLTSPHMPSMRRTQFAIHAFSRGGANTADRRPGQIDAYQVEFASRCDHEADQPSTYETRNRCNVSLHGMPTVNQREHPLDRERRECALTAINDMSFRSVVRNLS
jgi:hypothetical protein